MRRFIRRTILGLVVCAIASCLVPAIAVADGYQYAGKWGTRGTGDGQFDGIGGIAIDGSGNVYVSDVSNKRIEKFSASGTYVAQWGTLDSSMDGVAVDRSGNVYAADYWNHRILKFDSTGALLAQFNTKLADDFDSEPHSIAVDSAGSMWITDSGDSLVKKFSASGDYLGSLAKGSDPGQVSRPIGVAVDSADNVYVVDYLLYNVQKFTSSGTYLDGHTTIATGDANLLYPAHVAVDGAGSIYVADTKPGTLISDGSVKKFNSSFVLQTRIGVYSSSPVLDGSFCVVAGVAIGSSGTVYVADTTFDRVVEFTSSSVTHATTTTLTGPSSVKVRKTLKLSGTVSPSGASGSVKITKTRKVGTKWRSAGSVKVTVVNGSFRYSFKPTVKGSWRFVARYSGGGGYASSTSRTKTVKVK